MLSDLKTAHESTNFAVTNGEPCGKKQLSASVSGVSDKMLAHMWGGDRRLSVFGYTIETVNMLLVPMIQTKYVYFKILL